MLTITNNSDPITTFTRTLTTDEEFFGVSADGNTITGGQLNYDFTRDGGVTYPLSPIRGAVMAGNYHSAKERLLEYMKNRNISPDNPATRSLPFTDKDRDEHYANAALYNMFTFHACGEMPAGIIELGAEDTTVTRDVSRAAFDAAGKTNIIWFTLLGAEDTSKGSDRSRHGATVYGRAADKDKRPAMIITTGSGTLAPIYPAKTASIDGASRDTAFGPETLQINDGPTGYDENTKRAYMEFIFPDIPISSIKKVELRLTGKTNDKNNPEFKLGIYKSPILSYEENQITYDNMTFHTLRWTDLSLYPWNAPDKTDVQYEFSVGRMYFAVPLAVEYERSKDKKYTDKLVEIMDDLLSKKSIKNDLWPNTCHPNDFGGLYPDELSAARRAIEYLRCYDTVLNAGSFDKKAREHADVVKHLYEITLELRKEENFIGTNNHGQHSTRGMCSVALSFPEFKDTPMLLELIRKRIKALHDRLIMQDGSYVERTSMYTGIVAEAYMEFKEFAGLNNFDMDIEGNEGYYDRGTYMTAKYVANTVYPDGSDPQYGDSDIENWRHIYKKGGELFNDPGLTYIAANGEKGEHPGYESINFPSHRITAMRSGFSSDGLLAIMYTGANWAAHEHADRLGLVVYGYGERLLINTGRYTYDCRPEFWQIYEFIRLNNLGQNTIKVDDTNYRLNTDNPQKETGNGQSALVTNGLFDFAEGWTPKNPGKKTNRRVLFVKPGYFIVSDMVTPSPESKLEQAWHPRYDAGLMIDPVSKKGYTTYQNKPNIHIIPADPQEISAEVPMGWYCPQYSNVVNSEYLLYTKTGGSGISAAMDTVLYPVKAGENPDIQVKRVDLGVPVTTATALEIVLENNKTGHYYLSYEDSPSERDFNAFTYDGKLSYAETDGDKIKTALIQNGKHLRYNGGTVIKSRNTVYDIGVSYEAGVLNIEGSKLYKSPYKSSIAIFAPDAGAVKLNGETVDFAREGDYIYAVDAVWPNIVSETAFNADDYRENPSTTVDLGCIREISGAAIEVTDEISLETDYYAHDRAGLIKGYQYKVEVSIDNTAWTTVADRTKNKISKPAFIDQFAPVKARYVRLTVTGNDTSMRNRRVAIDRFVVLGGLDRAF